MPRMVDFMFGFVPLLRKYCGQRSGLSTRRCGADPRNKRFDVRVCAVVLCTKGAKESAERSTVILTAVRDD
eukprot:2624341-Amphidinium_carterae.1